MTTDELLPAGAPVQPMHHLAEPSDAHGPRSGAGPAIGLAPVASACLFQFAPSPMCLVRTDSEGRGRIHRTNLAFHRLLERDEANLIGSCFEDFVVPDQRTLVLRQLEELSHGADEGREELLPVEGPGVQLEIQLTSPGGRTWPGQVFIAPLPAPGSNTFLLAVDDLSAQQQAVEELRVQAFHDPLTHLPNRALILDRLQHALEADLRLGLGVSVYYLDLDGFKAINDGHGHATGDEVLKAVADILSLCVRGGDTVGRLGGDEFVVIAPALPEHLSGGLHRRLIQALLQGITLPGAGHLALGASIGVATSRHGESAGSVLEAADADMYRRKIERRARTAVTS